MAYTTPSSLRNFTLILAEDPNNAAALNNAANVYFLQGEADRANRLYRDAIESDPQEGGIHLNLGILLHASGDVEGSQEHVREGLALVGDVQHAYYLLGISNGEGDPGRASDQSGVSQAEIQALLSKAAAEVPEREDADAADGSTEGGAPEAGNTDRESAGDDQATMHASRPGGAKAAEVNTEAARLFWMTLPGAP